MSKIIIYKDNINDELEVCVYCGTVVGSEFSYRGCCGEVHSETIYITESGDEFRADEVTILSGSPPLSYTEKIRLEDDRKLDMYRGK